LAILIIDHLSDLPNLSVSETLCNSLKGPVGRLDITYSNFANPKTVFANPEEQIDFNGRQRD